LHTCFTTFADEVAHFIDIYPTTFFLKSLIDIPFLRTFLLVKHFEASACFVLWKLVIFPITRMENQ